MKPHKPRQEARRAMQTSDPTQTMAQDQIVAPEAAEWPIPPIAERLTSGFGQVNKPSAGPPRPTVADARVSLCGLLGRLANEQAALDHFLREVDFSAHPGEAQALEALRHFDIHLKSAWRCVGSAISALEW